MRKKAAVLFVLRMLKMGLSFFNLILAAKYFGVTLERDVWILALNCIIILDAALWGPVNETFRAKFISLKAERGERDALIASGSLFFITIVSSIIVVGLITVNRGGVASIIAPNFSYQDQQALALMLFALAPSLLVNQVTQLAIGILNAYESFYIPEVASCLASVLNILLVIAFAPSIGIYSLMLGYYAGLFILAALLFRQFVKRRIALFADIRRFRFRWAKPFILFALPFFIPYFFAQLNHGIEKSLASTLGIGVVSSLDYARKIPDFFLMVLSSVLTTMLVPVLSASFSQAKVSEAFADFRKILQMGMLMVALLICLVSTSAKEMVIILYDQGEIVEKALARIGELSMYYSWASLPIFLYLLFGLTLLSQNRGKVYAFVGLFAQLGMIVVNIALYKSFGPYVFPFALCLSHALAVVLLINFLPFDKYKILLILLKYLAILLLTWGGSMLFSTYFALSHVFWQLLLKSSFIVIWLFFLVYIFRTEEYKLVSTNVAKFFTLLKQKLMR